MEKDRINIDNIFPSTNKSNLHMGNIHMLVILYCICIFTSSTCSLFCPHLYALKPAGCVQGIICAELLWCDCWSKSNMASQLHWAQNFMYFIESGSCEQLIFIKFLNETCRIKSIWLHITIFSLDWFKFTDGGIC